MYKILAGLLCLAAAAPARASVVLMVGLSKAMPAWQQVVPVAWSVLVDGRTIFFTRAISYMQRRDCERPYLLTQRFPADRQLQLRPAARHACRLRAASAGRRR